MLLRVCFLCGATSRNMCMDLCHVHGCTFRCMHTQVCASAFLMGSQHIIWILHLQGTLHHTDNPVRHPPELTGDEETVAMMMLVYCTHPFTDFHKREVTCNLMCLTHKECEGQEMN